MFSVFREYLSGKIQLSDEDYRMIESLCIFKKLRKRQYLAQEGDIWRYNAFVCQGLLRTYRVDDKGVEHIINFAMENWWIGDRESLASGNPSGFNIDALEDSELLLLSKQAEEQLMERVPKFERYFRILLQNNLIATQRRLIGSLSQSAEERYNQLINGCPNIPQRVPQHMMASFLGITPETLSRIRKQVASSK